MKPKIESLPLLMNDADFLRLLRVAVSAGRMKVTEHALERMKERKISQMQVKACLQKELLSEAAHLTIKGDWKATMEYRHSGDFISVAAVLKQLPGGDFAIVVTVMNTG